MVQKKAKKVNVSAKRKQEIEEICGYAEVNFAFLQGALNFSGATEISEDGKVAAIHFDSTEEESGWMEDSLEFETPEALGQFVRFARQLVEMANDQQKERSMTALSRMFEKREAKGVVK
jgi:hypothetical protein